MRTKLYSAKNLQGLAKTNVAREVGPKKAKTDTTAPVRDLKSGTGAGKSKPLEELGPLALQGFPEAGGDTDCRVLPGGFDLLVVATVDVGEFCDFGLSEALGEPETA